MSRSGFGFVVTLAAFLIFCPGLSGSAVNGQVPDTFIDSGPPSQALTTTAIFNFHGTGDVAGFQCSLDSVAFGTCFSPATITSSDGALHTFRARAISSQGTPDATPASYSWTTNTTGAGFVLTAATAGNGAGLITGNPTGISCPSLCSVKFATDTVIVLTVTPNASTFTGWSGSGCTGNGTCTVTMSQARSVTANLVANISISGKVTGPLGQFVTNARLTLTGPTIPTPIIFKTGRSGAFNFANLPPGNSYTVTVFARRRFTFNPTSLTFTPSSDIANANFVAQ